MKRRYYKEHKHPGESGRYFYSQKQLAEFRHMVDVFNAWKKRNKKKPRSYTGVPCGCGCGPFISEYSENWPPPIPAPVPPQPKKLTKRSKKTHPMFSGYIVER